MGRWGAEETLAVVDSGSYVAPSGRTVTFADGVAEAVRGTRQYTPTALAALVAQPAAVGRNTRVEVTAEGSSQAGLRLAREGTDVAILNFASARNVGGGFLGGARAQEEDLCRASALFRCLETQPAYYQANRAHEDALYTDHLIYSPRVPFFRDGDGFTEAPYALSVLTSPAPNTGALLDRAPHLADRLRATFARRLAMVLAVARAHGHGRLVLGAWGCGAFRGDPVLVADVFREALAGPFAAAFDQVVFAVLVTNARSQANLDAFHAAFQI